MNTSVECADCGFLLDESSDVPFEERQPCPRCGSTRRVILGSVSDAITFSSSVSGEVERGLNDIRLAVLGILVTIGLTVGFGMPGPTWFRLLAGVGAFALAALLIRWRRVRKRLMAFMHWLTGA